MILDILLLIMTVICVFYCWVLNKRIQDLQNSRIEFARMIKELNASIIKAENNVNEMSELSKITSTEIKSVVGEAKEISTELITITEMASELSAKLNEQSSQIYTKNEVNRVADSNNNTIYENMTSKAGERFTEDDLAVEEEDNSNYTNHLKSFIQNIVTKKSDSPSQSLNQSGYYSTLRKINARKS